jgi:hypothetical protein
MKGAGLSPPLALLKAKLQILPILAKQTGKKMREVMAIAVR